MVDDIRKWLEELGLDKYGDLFVENEIDLDAARHLEDGDLKELELPMGPRKKLVAAIADLLAQSQPTSDTPDAAPEPATGQQAERRQLTVMFCDLVGSTALSQQLDPEDLRDVMRSYQDVVAGAVTRFGGYVAKYLGDGVLIYFGWPRAYEDQAERAVRAGLDAILAVSSVEMAGVAALAARVGIATGQVVVGDLAGEAGAITGETPNLAARLQGIAKPGQVVISQDTKTLVSGFFELEDIGQHELKGFAHAVPAFRPLRESTGNSRFEATRDTTLSNIVGRESELGFLWDRWNLANAGKGQVLLLSGEAGLGKSRLVRALADGLAGKNHYRLRYQCAPHYANSALYPIIQRLEQAAGFSSNDSGDDKLDKLERLLAVAEDDAASSMPFIAALMSLHDEKRHGALDLEPQELRARIMTALVRQLQGLSRLRPVFFVFEDAHWIDPSSVALLADLIAGISDLPVFMIITHRPEFEPPWKECGYMGRLTMNRLNSAQAAQIITNTVGEAPSREFVDEIVMRSEGNPLFIEELTKAVREASHLTEGKGMEIPATLQASLQSRLDSLGEARNLAQIGAVIGREFSYAILAAIANSEEAGLQAALAQLVQSELVFQRGHPPEATYSFKHALVQDAAYASLLLETRRGLHGRIARYIEEETPDLAENQPELLAQHYQQAREYAISVDYRLAAARRAAERSATDEAIRHLERGLKLSEQLHDGADKVNRQLDLFAYLSASYTARYAYASNQTRQIVERAFGLIGKGGSLEREFTAIYSISLLNGNLGKLDKTREGAVALRQRAEQIGDPELQCIAWRLDGFPRFFLGQIEDALSPLRKGFACYDPEKHKDSGTKYGHDIGIGCLTWLFQASWFLGNFRDAAEYTSKAQAISERIQHRHTTRYLLHFEAFIALMDGDVEQLESIVAREYAIDPARTNVVITNQLKCFEAGAMALRGDFDGALTCFQHGREQLRSANASLMQSVNACTIVEILHGLGRLDEALEAAEEAIAALDKYQEYFMESQAHRIHGEVLFSMGQIEEAEEAFAEAINVADRQGAKPLHLRAVMAQSRLLVVQDQNDAALKLLQSSYSQFTEGFDMPDLIKAKELLDEIS